MDPTNTMSPGELAGHMDSAAREHDSNMLSDLQTRNAALEEANAELGERLERVLSDNRQLALTLVDTEKWLTESENELYRKDTEEYMRKSAQQVAPSRIRVYLSRQLTWSEAETFRNDHHVVSGRLPVPSLVSNLRVRVNRDRRAIYVDANLPSRDLYAVVASALEAHFVNVHPVAVRTFAEYNGYPY